MAEYERDAFSQPRDHLTVGHIIKDYAKESSVQKKRERDFALPPLMPEETK